jgi:hypothetical protein
VLTPHMTCEMIYKNNPINKRRWSRDLQHPPTPLRSSNVGLFTFKARVVMSYLEVRYEHLLAPRKSMHYRQEK